jgi:Xaa-Pro aminopeptidase
MFVFMRYTPIRPELYLENRRRLAALLPPKSVAILHANDVLPSNADGTIGFRQNNDLLYLSGVDQEESILVLFPDAFNEKHREMLFLRETSELLAIWDGEKLSKEKARELSGIQNVHWLPDFDNLLPMLLSEAESVFLNTNEHARRRPGFQAREDRFTLWMREQYPLHRLERLAPLMRKLRILKHPLEVDTIREACAITRKGFNRLLKFVRPGVTEYEIEAELAREFIRNRARFAFLPIIGSGRSGCILHYIENNATCRAGDLVLIDIGSEYANYASDLTRTVPVNGRYTRRQRQVYEAVLRVTRHCMKTLRPGVLLRDHEKQVAEVMQEELLGLGLLTKAQIRKQDPDKPAYRKYFMHSTSHHLGLDVHDVAPVGEPMAAGMVMTIEPGIYIREEKLGIRLENTVLITEDGIEDLMADIPIEAADIEDAMRRGR